MTDRITIKDLEVQFHVGVPDEERAEPQKLLITIEMTHDLVPSGASDNLAQTIDYYTVSQAVKALGQARRGMPRGHQSGYRRLPTAYPAAAPAR